MKSVTSFLIKAVLFLSGVAIVLLTLLLDISLFSEGELPLIGAMLSLIPLWIGGVIIAVTEHVDDFLDWVADLFSETLTWGEDVLFWIGDYTTSGLRLLWELISSIVSFASMFFGPAIFFIAFATQFGDGSFTHPSSFNEAKHFIVVALLTYIGVLAIRYLIYLGSFLFAPSKRVISQPDYPTHPVLGTENTERGMGMGKAAGALFGVFVLGTTVFTVPWASPFVAYFAKPVADTLAKTTGEFGGGTAGGLIGQWQDKESYKQALEQYRVDVSSIKQQYEDTIRQTHEEYYQEVILPRVNRFYTDLICTTLIAGLLIYSYWSS